jgi:hypothetical protein
MNDEEFDLWSDDSNWEERPRFYEPVDIIIDGNNVTWVPGQEFLTPKTGEGAQSLADSIHRSIHGLSDSSGQIYTVPLGQYLPATVANLSTVFWVINMLYEAHEVKYLGEVPTIEDIIGEPDGWNEDGTAFTVH